MTFKKIIIWGHKLHSHSHSYIHYGFFKAFKSMGYDTYWFDNLDDISNFNFENSLFLTESQVDENMPIVKSSKYITHSIIPNKIINYEPNIFIDILTNQNKLNSESKIDDFTYIKSKTLIQPWATDLLPEEFDFDSALAERKSESYFFGTVVRSGWNDNENQITEFDNCCKRENIFFTYQGLYSRGPIDSEESIKLMKSACLAPCIQSSQQIEAGYVTDRLIKNISYGHYGMTNSKPMYDLFNNYLPGLIYNYNITDMFNSSLNILKSDPNKSILLNQMNYIKNNHTYINRINNILNFLKEI